MRLGLGQIGAVVLDTATVGWRFRSQNIPGNIRAIESVLGVSQQLITDLPSSHSSYGLGSKELPDTVGIAYDIFQTFRHHRSWDINPNGSWTYQYDKPLQYSKESFPVFIEEG